MKKSRGASLLSLKALNELQIRRSIYYNAPVTRQQIADQLGVSLPTVTTNVAQMLADGLLEEYTGDSSPLGGRKPQWLDFRPDSRFAIGLEQAAFGALACVTDLRGHVVCRRELPVQNDYDAMLSVIGKYTDLLIKEAGISREVILGVGMGLPGFIDSSHNTVRTGPFANLTGRDLAKELSLAAGLPAWINNNARMRTLWREMFSGLDGIPATYVYLFVSKGIACPMMIRDNLLIGKGASAGEIGHTTILPGGPVCPVCGRRGCLDAVSSERAILRQLNAELPDQSPWDIRGALHAQTQGDPTVCRILEEAVHYLGLAVANVFNFISPGLFSVDGLIFENERNQELLLETVKESLFGLSFEEAQVEFLPHDPYTGAYGAAAFVVRQSLLV